VQAFAIVGLKRELGYLMRSAMWFGLWFPIMAKPVNWAHDARRWKTHGIRSAQVVKWDDGFITVHQIVWRVLLTFVLYAMVGLIKAAIGKYMSFHFHYRNHSAKMQVVYLIFSNASQLFAACMHALHHTLHTSFRAQS
jgi:hypothetical protein